MKIEWKKKIEQPNNLFCLYMYLWMFWKKKYLLVLLETTVFLRNIIIIIRIKGIELECCLQLNHAGFLGKIVHTNKTV